MSVTGTFAGLITANYIDAFQSRVTAVGLFYPVVSAFGYVWGVMAIGCGVRGRSYVRVGRSFCPCEG